MAEVRAMVKTLIYCLENYGGRDVMCVTFFLAFYKHFFRGNRKDRIPLTMSVTRGVRVVTSESL